MARIPLNEIYQQKLNFLIGAGASSGLFSTLWLAVKDSDNPEKEETIETLATKLAQLGEQYKHHHTLLFMYYFQNIIEPVCKFQLSDVIKTHKNCKVDNCKICKEDELRIEATVNYEIFIDSIVRLLQQKSEFQRRCNLFTTNYDGCIPLVVDNLIKKGNLEFCINDGASGFLDRTLSARNFSNYVCKSGVFGRNSSDIPQINYINLHGSAYWRKSGDNIKVDYKSTGTAVLIPENTYEKLKELGKILNDKGKTTIDVLALEVELSNEVIDQFWDSYNKLPIVNPTKWKFHETVFEEHYYQMLRLLSYRLEEPNSVLISFAFSFADEHIRNLIKRSLSNPKLQVFVCCFNEKEHKTMQGYFNGYRNVTFIEFGDKKLDFTKFNKEVFNADLLRVDE
ncbi:hypothetical protein CXF80_10145 [Shewanella sp. Actino-trap-3]|jgi:hypothetical protein|uniref:hypothetical protein n=1 Tax=Shewanella sp. Actino-trap-3 TaxID=2058331 RepID=UPI000C333F77|nr:hypothetical protein [Shewanella sp. Actino-trap-3]PKG78646.1 hypothetical protein CXF80_10145 [Shewanella sp. Actino-trap-3]